MTTVYNRNGIPFDIDAIASDLNGKADLDLLNCSETGTIWMAHNAMPSYEFINLTLGATESEYIAPADGYFALGKIATSAGQYVTMGLLQEDKSSSMICSKSIASINNQPLYVWIPVKTGQTIQIDYNASGSVQGFHFVYAEGSKSEAN